MGSGKECSNCDLARSIAIGDYTLDSNGRIAISEVNGFQRGCLSVVDPKRNPNTWTVVEGENATCINKNRFKTGTPVSGALPPHSPSTAH